MLCLRRIWRGPDLSRRKIAVLKLAPASDEVVSRFRRGVGWQWSWLALLLAMQWFMPGILGAEEFKEKSILILYSHEREMSVYAELDQALRSALQSGSSSPAEFYTEYLDLIRFPDERHQQELVDYLQVKYAGRKIDLIFAVSPLALNFLIQHGRTLFAGIPAVFTPVDVRRIDRLFLTPNITGVAVKHEIRDTVDFALQLQPDIARVIVPTGSSMIEKSWAEETRKALLPYGGRLAVTMLADLPMNEMLKRLKNLPPHTMVLFASSFFYDAAGNYFLPEEALDLICRAANAPVYSTDAPYLGHGIVGGSLLDLAEPGAVAGRIGKRILEGEKPGAIPVQTIDPNHIMADARQLKRWGISENKLPPGSVVLFRQDSAWDVYKWYVIGSLVLFALQSLLIVTLVMQRRKVKHSAMRLKELSQHLINAQEEERRRIARELHDDFGQRLALLKIDLENRSLQEELPKTNGRGSWDKLLSDVNELANDIQDLSHTLHSTKLQYVGLKSALKDLCRQISTQHHIDADLSVGDLASQIPIEIALCFYRVAQEGLHNAAKHSGASRIVVAVSGRNALLRMLITDNGKGFRQTEHSQGMGLASMRERLRMIGGELRVRSIPGRGTQLSAQAPVKEPAAQSKAS
jgi:signal transduction histidine kinase